MYCNEHNIIVPLVASFPTTQPTYKMQTMKSTFLLALLSIASLCGATQELTAETYQVFLDSGMFIMRNPVIFVDDKDTMMNRIVYCLI